MMKCPFCKGDRDLLDKQICSHVLNIHKEKANEIIQTYINLDKIGRKMFDLISREKIPTDEVIYIYMATKALRESIGKECLIKMVEDKSFYEGFMSACKLEDVKESLNRNVEESLKKRLQNDKEK